MSEREQLEQAMAALEAQRPILGDAVVETSLAALRRQLAARPRAAGAEQRKLVTVLFADISGFTAMSEHRDPEEVRDIMNALWARLDAIILDHGGTIDKHIGDAVMALFGAATAHEEDPERAIRAALALQAELARRADPNPPAPVGGTNESVHLPSPPRGEVIALRMRVGIHTGPVLLGAVGTTAEYTALGDTVNLASRLEHAAPVGSILISHDTYRHVRGVFDVQPLAPLTVKGKSAPIRTYLVQQAKPRAFRLATRGVEGIETRMVGRAAELQQLRDTFAAVLEDGEPQVITVVGEAGIGKSRLLDEFTAWLELQPATVWLFKGRADPQWRHLPYSLIRDLIAFRFGIQDSDRVGVARAKLEAGVREFMGATGTAPAHFLGQLIGLDFAASPYLGGILDDARQIRERAFQSAGRFFAAVTRARPAVLLLEDLHWADDGSLDLIDHLVRAAAPGPLLIVGLARPGLLQRRPSWGEGQDAHTRLELRPLSRQAGRRLVAEILRLVPDPPPALRDLIVAHAEGNPFYVEELVKILIEDGVIVPDPAQWQVAMDRLATVRVPPTLTGILQARLDRLPPAEQAVLHRAAVVGRIFWDEAVAWLHAPEEAGSPPPPAGVGPLLGALREKELIFRRETATFAATLEYVFKHALLRDVAYARVLLRHRRVYHAQVAAWLVERSGERADEYAGLIGEHYEQAGDFTAAAEWYARAGRQAQATYAGETAITYYRQALALLPGDAALPTSQEAPRLAIYEGLGETLERQARYAEAADAFATMATVAATAGDAIAEARAWTGLAVVQDSQGDPRASLDSATRAEALARAAGALAERAAALYRQGFSFYRLGDAAAALALGEQSLALSTQARARKEMARSLNLLGGAHELLGHYDQAAAHFRQALALERALGNRRRVGGMLNNLGETARVRGDYEAATALFEEALAVAREIGDPDAEMLFLSSLGAARVGLGAYAAAEADLREAIARGEAAGGRFFLSYSYRALAEALLDRHEIAGALDAGRQALALAQETGQPAQIGEAWRALGQVAAAQGAPIAAGAQIYDADTCFAESLRLFTAMGLEREQARTLRAWAAALPHDPPRAAALADEARAIFARLDLTAELARTPAPPPPTAAAASQT